MTASMEHEEVFHDADDEVVEEKENSKTIADNVLDAKSTDCVKDQVADEVASLDITDAPTVKFPLPELSEKEEKALEETRNLVADDKRLASLKLNDLDLIRWLRARNFSPQNVEKSLQVYADFHEKHDLHNIDLSLPPYPIRGFPHPQGDDAWLKHDKWKQLNRILAMATHKHDREGRPLFFMRVGSSPVSDLEKVDGGLDKVLEWHVTCSEYMHSVVMPHLSEQHGKNIEKGLYIYDCEGLGLSAMGGKRIVQAMAKLDDAVYPERLARLLVINAPRLIGMFWSIVKVMLHPVTREKFTICTGDYKKELFAMVDPKNVPAIYGGECVCDCRGGCVPTNEFLKTVEYDVESKEEE